MISDCRIINGVRAPNIEEEDAKATLDQLNALSVPTITEYRVKRAGEDPTHDNAAAEILRTYGFPGGRKHQGEPTDKFQADFFFDETDRSPRILAVGFAGEIPVTAASLCEGICEDKLARGYNGKKFFELLLIATDPAFRGQGLTRDFINVLAHVGRTGDCDYLYAVWPRDDSSRAFYEKLGFDIVPYPTWGGDYWLPLR